MEKMQGPIFLVGAGRSGTTMLRLMLNQHPLIRIPSEAWFIGNLIDHLPLTGPLSSAQLDLACRLILSHDRWKDWQCEDHILRDTVHALPNPTLSNLIDRIFRSCSGLGDKSVWGEKSPRHSYYVTALHTLFPEARFIHIVRDARDVCTAMLLRNWYEGSVRRCAMSWDGMVGSAMRAREFGPDRYLQISFEDLIRNPESVLRSACQFLHMDYLPRMLDYSSNVKADIKLWETDIHEKLRRSPDLSEIGKWRALKLWQLLIIESLVGENLKKAGYRPGCPWWLAWAKLPCRLACDTWQRLREFSSKIHWPPLAGTFHGLTFAFIKWPADFLERLRIPF